MIAVLGTFLLMWSSLPQEAARSVLGERETMHPGDLCSEEPPPTPPPSCCSTGLPLSTDCWWLELLPLFLPSQVTVGIVLRMHLCFMRDREKLGFHFWLGNSRELFCSYVRATLGLFKGMFYSISRKQAFEKTKIKLEKIYAGSPKAIQMKTSSPETSKMSFL